MGGRLVEAITGLAVLASAAILVAMLAAPLVVPVTTAPSPEASPTPSDEAAPSGAPAVPPLGQFVMDGPLNFGDLCLGLELEPRAYPVAANAPGVATVFWWQSTIVDPGNPAACASRAGDLNEVEAVVQPIRDEDDPGGAPIGYTLLFHLPGPTGAERDMEIALLTAQSVPDRIQALDMSTSGSGLLFLRTGAIDPPLEARPSPSAAPVAWPDGLFLLRGPLASDGPCLVLDMTAPPPPAEPSAVGTASIRWWEPGGDDAADPTYCFSRIGDVHTGPADLTTMLAGDDPLGVIGFDIHFVMPVEDPETPQDVSLTLLLEQQTPDQLVATAVWGSGPRPVVFDRVDSIDPAPAP